MDWSLFLFVCLSICLFCLSVCLSVCLFVCLPVCLSVCLCLFAFLLTRMLAFLLACLAGGGRGWLHVQATRQVYLRDGSMQRLITERQASDRIATTTPTFQSTALFCLDSIHLPPPPPPPPPPPLPPTPLTTSKRTLLLFIGCLASQKHASVSQGRICSDNFTCCHTETEVADPTFHLTQSQYIDAGPTSPSAEL